VTNSRVCYSPDHGRRLIGVTEDTTENYVGEVRALHWTIQ